MHLNMSTAGECDGPGDSGISATGEAASQS